MTNNRPVSEMVERCPIPTKLRPYIDAYKMSAGQLGKWAEQFIHDHTDTTGYGWDRRWMGQRIREILDYVEANYVAAASSQPPSDVPTPMMLFCPKCGLQHIDAPDERTPDWDNPPHKSHLCHGCGCIWRPADVPTEGVAAIQTRGSKDTVFYNAAAIPSAVASDVVERANEITVALTEVMLEEFSLNEDNNDDCRRMERWGERADQIIAAALAAIPSAGGVEEMREALSDDECAVCGKSRKQHFTGSGMGVCQIYPVFRSRRAVFSALLLEARAALESTGK